MRVGLGLTVGQAEAHGVDEHESVEAPVLQLRRERLVLPGGGGARGRERGPAGARQPAKARGRTAADPLPPCHTAGRRGTRWPGLRPNPNTGRAEAQWPLPPARRSPPTRANARCRHGAAALARTCDRRPHLNCKTRMTKLPQMAADACCIRVRERKFLSKCCSVCFELEFVKAPEMYQTRMYTIVMGVMKAMAPWTG